MFKTKQKSREKKVVFIDCLESKQKSRDKKAGPVYRDEDFSYKQKKKTVSANRGPRFTGLEPGQIFSYKHPLRWNNLG